MPSGSWAPRIPVSSLDRTFISRFWIDALLALYRSRWYSEESLQVLRVNVYSKQKKGKC